MEDNVHAASYYVLIATASCPGCGAPTRLLALALPPGHAVLDEASAEWTEVAAVAMLSFVARLPSAVIARLQEHTAGYRLDASLPSAAAYWANGCLLCAAQFDDDMLHSEPDVAFLPSSEAQAANIELHHILQPITACVRGLSLAPQFFHAMRRA